MSIELQDLGVSAEELRDLVVGRMVGRLISEACYDEDGEDTEVSSRLKHVLDAKIKDGIDVAVDALATKHVLPNIEGRIEAFTLQATNKWGDRTGKPLTFTEYLVARADDWMQETVDFQGKTQKEDSYNWKANTTRVAYLIDKHLQYHIERAMKGALDDANSSIVGGLKKAVEVSLAQVSEKLKVKVTT